MRKLIVATLVAAMSVLGTAVPFASAKTVPAQVGRHPATSVVYSTVAQLPSRSRLASCGAIVPPAYGSGLEAILWECDGHAFHAEAINQTGYTINMCAGIFVSGSWHWWCATAPNGYGVNTGTYSSCSNTAYEGGADDNVAFVHTAETVCNIA